MLILHRIKNGTFLFSRKGRRRCQKQYGKLRWKNKESETRGNKRRIKDRGRREEDNHEEDDDYEEGEEEKQREELPRVPGGAQMFIPVDLSSFSSISYSPMPPSPTVLVESEVRPRQYTAAAPHARYMRALVARVQPVASHNPTCPCKKEKCLPNRPLLKILRRIQFHITLKNFGLVGICPKS